MQDSPTPKNTKIMTNTDLKESPVTNAPLKKDTIRKEAAG